MILYLELIVQIVGTMLYVFLARELFRRGDLPSARLLRLFVVAVTIWFAGTLLDTWLTLLFGVPDTPTTFLGLIDISRGLAWLIALPLLTHTLAALDESMDGRVRGPIVVLGYLGILLFVQVVYRQLAGSPSELATLTSSVYPRLVIHAGLTLPAAAFFAGRLAHSVRPRRLARFFKALRLWLVGLFIVVALGLLARPWTANPDPLDVVVRLGLAGGLIGPGMLFALWVQRHNLLRLSLSNRALRHLVIVLSVVLTALLVGPALGTGDLRVAHRFVAWGTLVAMLIGLIGPWLLERAMATSTTVRAFLGRTVEPRELDRLTDALLAIDDDGSLGDGDDLLDGMATVLQDWLGTEVSVLPRTTSTEPLWRLFTRQDRDAPDVDIAHRLQPLSTPVIGALDRHGLHAALAVRTSASGEVRGLLGLCAQVSGGAWADGELEAVRLVLRSATAVAAVRELAQRRVLEERRVAEHERLQQLGLVAASLAHEIKNPLSAIKAITQGVRTDLADERTVRDDDLADLDLIVEQIDRLDRVARDILGFARPSQGTTTDLTQLTRSAITVLEAEAKKRAVTLTSQIADDVTVFGGVAAWQTITFNLVLNAVEHSRAGDTVSVHLTGADGTDTHDTDTHGTGADDEAVLTTTNPGTLADPETIFEAFDSDGGIGLGLALVARRVAECNARIEVEHHDDEIRFTVTARTATPPTEMS